MTRIIVDKVSRANGFGLDLMRRIRRCDEIPGADGLCECARWVCEEHEALAKRLEAVAQVLTDAYGHAEAPYAPAALEALRIARGES